MLETRMVENVIILELKLFTFLRNLQTKTLESYP